MVINSIKEIFKNNSELPALSSTLIIKETENSHLENTLKKITLKNIKSQEFVCYKLDKHVPLTKYFEGTNSKGINKAVDAVLFYLENNIGYILFFELKSFTLNKKEVANKYFASTAFIHQICYLLKNVYDENITNFNASAIVFSLNQKNERVKKFGMRPDIPTFKNTNYTNTKKSIQVLEISKNNGDNFSVPIDKILNEARHKPFKNWP